MRERSEPIYAVFLIHATGSFSSSFVPTLAMMAL